MKQKKALLGFIILLVVVLFASRYFFTKMSTPELIAPVVKTELPLAIAQEEAEKKEKTLPVVRESIPIATPQASKSTSTPADKEGKKPKPDWFNNLYALYEKYYPSWQTNRTVAPSSSVVSTPSSSLTASAVQPSLSGGGGGVPSSSSDRGLSSVSSSPEPISLPATNSAGLKSSGSGSDSGGTPLSGSENKSENKDNNEETPPPASNVVMVARNISSSGGDVSYITLNITVNTDVTGLIITENIPDGYSITSASPNYSKKVGNRYSWLLYGATVTSQTITY